MPGSGTRTFLEPDHYEASLRQAQINIVIAWHSSLCKKTEEPQCRPSILPNMRIDRRIAVPMQI